MVYKGGAAVAQGTYWDIKKGIRIDTVQDSILPGTTDKIYIKASAATMLLVSPVLGLMFAVFLPFIGIAAAISVFVRRVLGGSVEVLARSMSFGWKPIEAYLSGRKQKEDLRRKNLSISDILDTLNSRPKKDHGRKGDDLKR